MNHKPARWREQGVGIAVSCYANVLILLCFSFMCVYVYMCVCLQIYLLTPAYAHIHTFTEQDLCSGYFPSFYHVSDSCVFFPLLGSYWRDRHESINTTHVTHRTCHFLVTAVAVNIYQTFIPRLCKASGRWSSSPCASPPVAGAP